MQIIAVGLITLFLLTYLMYIVDVYVLGWFGLPTWEGWGIPIVGAITVFFVILWATYQLTD